MTATVHCRPPCGRSSVSRPTIAPADATRSPDLTPSQDRYPPLGAARLNRPANSPRRNPHSARGTGVPHDSRVSCMGPPLSSAYFSSLISLVRPRRRLSLVPTAGFPGRRAQGVSRLAALQRPPSGSALTRPSTRHARGDRDDVVEGSSQLADATSIAPQPCIRWVKHPDHDAVLRIGCEAPKRRAHSSLRHLSHRTSAGCPPPRTVIGDTPLAWARRSCEWS
jgi:hypothetical protein